MAVPYLHSCPLLPVTQALPGYGKQKHVERERATRQLRGAAPPQPIDAHLGSGIRPGGVAGTSGRASVSEQAVMREVQTLYASHDEYSLKEGQTIK